MGTRLNLLLLKRGFFNPANIESTLIASPSELIPFIVNIEAPVASCILSAKLSGRFSINGSFIFTVPICINGNLRFASAGLSINTPLFDSKEITGLFNSIKSAVINPLIPLLISVENISSGKNIFIVFSLAGKRRVMFLIIEVFLSPILNPPKPISVLF